MCEVFCGQRGDRTYESLEEIALEDVDDPLDGVSELPVLGVVQLGPVLLQQLQRSLCVCTTGGGSSERGEPGTRQSRGSATNED